MADKLTLNDFELASTCELGDKVLLIGKVLSKSDNMRRIRFDGGAPVDIARDSPSLFAKKKGPVFEVGNIVSCADFKYKVLYVDKRSALVERTDNVFRLNIDSPSFKNYVKVSENA